MKKQYIHIIVFIFGAVLYLNTLPNKYAYDDFSVIEGNKFTKQGITGIFSHLSNDSFTGFTGQKNLFRGGRYRPLSLVTFSIEYQIFGASPMVRHLLNLLLYGLVCMLLYKVMVRLLQEKTAFRTPKDYVQSLPLVAVLIFAVHPIHTEVTANIKGRDELMALLFGLLSWNAFIRFVDENKPWQACYGGLFFFLAMLSKESAAPFLAMIPVSLYCCRTKSLFKRSGFITSAGLLAAFVIFLIIRQSVLGWSVKPTMPDNILSNSFMYANGLSERYGTAFYTLGLYLKLLLFPHPLTIDYYPFYIPYVGMADVRAIMPLVMYAGLSVLAVWLTIRKNLAGFGLLFYLVTLFPVSNLPFIIGPFMGERFLFIPSLGFSIVIAWILIWGAKRLNIVNMLPWVAGVLLFMMSVKTIARNFDWKDSFTLYTTDVRTSVNSAIITKGAGHELLIKAEAASDPIIKRDFAQKAVGYLEQAWKLNKTETEGFLLGNALYENGDFEMALAMYLETLRLDIHYDKAYMNFFIAANRLPSPADKIKYFNIMLKTAGERFEPYYQKGLVFGKEMHQIDSSIVNLVRASRIDSTHLDCLSDLGVAFAMKGNFGQSAVYLEKALRINPGDARIRQNLAASYYGMGQLDKAKALSGRK